MNPFRVEIDAKSLGLVREKLELLIAGIGPAALATAGQVGGALVNAASSGDDGYPSVPKAPAPLGGNLRSSHAVETFMVGREPVLQVSYSTPYAAAIHEGGWETGPLAGVRIKNWSEPGSGPGFLRNRIVGNRKYYINLWVSKIIRRMGL